MRGTCAVSRFVSKSLRRTAAALGVIAAIVGRQVPSPAASSTPPLAREEMMAVAHALASYTWTASAGNLTASCKVGAKYKGRPYHSDYTPGQQVSGIAYDWGGMDDPTAFDGRLKKGYAAGSHRWHECSACGVCTTGMDCSGFVSYVWGQRETKYSTKSIVELTTPLPLDFDKYRDLRRGDALNLSGSHIVLFDAYDTDGKPFVYEAAGAPDSRVLRQKRDWASLANFVAVRYANLTNP